MAKTLSEIYNEARKYRDQYLGLTEYTVTNSSKMSVMDAMTWMVSACVWSFSNILDVFQVDVASDIRNRINGTPSYYANALLKYQHGDQLIMNPEGTGFQYPQVNTSKRIISRVSFQEVGEEGFYDKQLIYKVASGQPGSYSRLTSDQLIGVQAYLDQISFAGTHLQVVSYKGDILVPKLNVYHDGALTSSELYSNIESALDDFIAGVGFDGKIYAQKVVDAIMHIEHVVDVDYSSEGCGVYVAQYDADGHLIPTPSGDYLTKISRYFTPNSGFTTQSDKREEQSIIPTWKESVNLYVDE